MRVISEKETVVKKTSSESVGFEQSQQDNRNLIYAIPAPYDESYAGELMSKLVAQSSHSPSLLDFNELFKQAEIQAEKEEEISAAARREQKAGELREKARERVYEKHHIVMLEHLVLDLGMVEAEAFLAIDKDIARDHEIMAKKHAEFLAEHPKIIPMEGTPLNSQAEKNIPINPASLLGKATLTAEASVKKTEGTVAKVPTPAPAKTELVKAPVKVVENPTTQKIPAQKIVPTETAAVAPKTVPKIEVGPSPALAPKSETSVKPPQETAPKIPAKAAVNPVPQKIVSMDPAKKIIAEKASTVSPKAAPKIAAVPPAVAPKTAAKITTPVKEEAKKTSANSVPPKVEPQKEEDGIVAFSPALFRVSKPFKKAAERLRAAFKQYTLATAEAVTQGELISMNKKDELILAARDSRGLVLKKFDQNACTWSDLFIIDYFSDKISWNNPCYGETIQTQIINVQGIEKWFILCRDSKGIRLFTIDLNSKKPTLISTLQLYCDKNDWNKEKHYKTIQTQVLNYHGRDRLFLIARDSMGIQISLYDPVTNVWFDKLPRPGFFNDASGWHRPYYYETIKTAVFNFAGEDKLALVARDSRGLGLYIFNPILQVWGSYARIDRFSDKVGWGLPQYYKTIQIQGINIGGQGKLLLISRDCHGVNLDLFDPIKNVWTRLAPNPNFSDKNGFGNPEFAKTIKTTVMSIEGRDQLVLTGKNQEGVKPPNLPHLTTRVI